MPLEEKKVADYLTVHGQYVKVTGKEAPYKVWVFGTKDRLYDLNSEDYDFRITREQIDTLHSGTYTILLQYRGVNYNFDVSWNEDTEELGRTSKNPWENHKIVEESGRQPSMVLDDLKALLDETDDKYATYKLVIEDPMLQIMGLDPVEVRSAKEYYNDISLRGNVSIYHIVGYTNVLPMTGLKFALDEDEQGKIQWFTGEAKGSDPGAMRQFIVNIPIYKDNMVAKIHEITGYTVVGGSVTYNFPISYQPEHSFIPDQPSVYVGGPNPWYPNLTTPTPVIVKVPGPVITVTIHDTPSDYQLYKAAREAEDYKNAENWKTVWNITGIIVLAELIIVGIYYLFVYYRRAKAKRELAESGAWDEAV